MLKKIVILLYLFGLAIPSFAQVGKENKGFSTLQRYKSRGLAAMQRGDYKEAVLQFDAAIAVLEIQHIGKLTTEYLEVEKLKAEAEERGKENNRRNNSIQSENKWVDLGLSVNWATSNLGASTPEGYGDYYAWGEIITKSDYRWDTYRWCNGTYDSLKKYNTNSSYGWVDHCTRLESADDVARERLGAGWRIPSKEEFWELIDACICSWETYKSVRGMKITSTINGESIFLPAAGYMKEDYLDQDKIAGYYWSSSLVEGHSFGAYRLWFKKNKQPEPSCDDGNRARYYGMQIRPVLEQ